MLVGRLERRAVFRVLLRSYMRVVAMLAWPSHSCTLAISASWSRSIGARGRAQRVRADIETEFARIGAHQLVNAVRRHSLVEPAAHRPSRIEYDLGQDPASATAGSWGATAYSTSCTATAR